MKQEEIEGYRLSPQQQRLWRLQQHSRAFCSQCAILLDGPLDAAALEASLHGVVNRHEILRTAFRQLAGMSLPLQVIAPDGHVLMHQLDWNECRVADEQRQVVEFLRAEREQPFDYERGQVLRAGLVRLAAERHLLVVSVPALCGDVRTLQNLVREVGQHYGAVMVGASEESREVVQYVQFSEWQHELLESEEGAEGQHYWREQAGRWGKLAEPRLPQERGQRGEGAAAYEQEEVRRELGPEMLAEIEEVAEQQGSTSEAILLACWQSLLWRLTGGAAFAVRVALDGRKYEEMSESLGLYLKWLPIPHVIEGNSLFNELLKNTSRSLNASYMRQEYYAPPIVHSPSDQSPLSYPIGYESLTWSDSSPQAPLRLTCAGLYSCTERFKLKLSGLRLSGGLRLQFAYDPQVYERAGIERLAEQYVTLLASAVTEPEQLVSRLAVVGAAERQQILVEWNETGREYPRDKCVHELFEEQVERTPEAVAVVSEAERVSYRELNERANQLAHHLRSLGVGPEEVVGVSLDRSIEMVVGVLGVLKAGGAYLPLEPADPLERRQWMVEDAGARLVVTQQGLTGLWGGSAVKLVSLDTEAINERSVKNPATAVGAENLAYVIYTSGSTGRPKGVMIQHRSAVNVWMSLEQSIYGGHGRSLRVSLNAPLSFDASVKQLLQLLSGRALCIVPAEVRREPEALVRYLSEQEVKVFDTTPSQLRQLLGAGEANLPEVVLVGGEAVDGALLKQMSECRGSSFYNVYGPTECTVDATACRAAGIVPTIGRPLANTQVYILDAHQQVVPIGVAGEIYIGGEGLARGYLNRPELTAERFIAHPYSRAEGARLYRTGDLGRYWASGEIEYLGRLDGQVKVRGYRIELGEVEAALSEHKAVEQAVVVVREGGPGEKRLVAYLVMESSDAVNIGDVRQFLREKLPEYMIPTAFVILPTLPLTRHGKVDRTTLPAPEQMESRAEIVAPRTPVEELLVNLYAEVLRVERVSTADNFFDLGGHSLLATQLISRIREVFQLEVPLRLLFEQPTVTALAQGIERLLKAGDSAVSAPPIERVSRERPLPLSFAQQRLWFIDQLEAGSPFYNSPAAVRLSGRLDLNALEQTFTEVVRRHEVLRTHFAVMGGEPVQVIAEAEAVSVPVTDLSRMGEREEEVERLAREEAQRPFDLSQGPLLRVQLLRLGEEEHVLLLTMHHIVSDAWSMGVLVREVAALYSAYSEGRPSPLEELPIQYADYAQWQREWLTGEVLGQQLSYWREQLGGELLVLELPTDHPRPSVQSYRGGQLSFEVGEEVTSRLKELSQQQGATLFMTLLSAFHVLLMRYSSQEDVIVGTPVAGRTRTELEGLIGFFVNTLVLRTDLSGDPTFVELIGRVREVCLGAYAHQDVPFEKLVEELAPERTLSHTPLFQVAFGVQNVPVEVAELAGLRLEPVRAENETGRYDLTLWMSERGGMLSGRLTYNRELYEEERVRRMAGHYRRLLESIVEGVGERISQLQMLTDEELRQRTIKRRTREEANVMKLRSIERKPVRTT